MKKITPILLFLSLLFSTNTFSQKKPPLNPIYKTMMTDMTVNVHTVCDSAEAFFKKYEKYFKREAKEREEREEKKRKQRIRNKDGVKVLAVADDIEEEDEVAEGIGYQSFERWKYENMSKYGPSGNRLIDESLPYQEYLRIKNESGTNSNQQRSSQSSSGWQSLGPNSINTITGHYAPGLGRVEFVEVNPINDQEIYLGSRSGGLWRTSNGGTTWSHNTDYLPASGVNAIAANPSNFNSVLINIRSASSGISFGVYKSNDGGTTFTPTNFIPANLSLGGLGSTFKIYTIQYHPTIPNLVFVGTSQGLYRSTDNLQTWTQLIAGGDVMDVDFHPTNDNIIYIYDDYFATNKNRVLKSTNLGIAFTPMASLTGNNNVKLKISVAASCPDCVFVSSDNGIWKSTDAGVTYTAIQNPPPTGVSLWQAMPNDLDVTKFVCGYLDLFRSTDSGTTFNQCTWWSLGTNNGSGSNQQNYNTSTHYVHADNDYLDCVNGVFYACTDGFLSKSTDNGITWQKISLTVGIRENYCVGISQSNNAVAICGSQDNGQSIKNENGWTESYGADGMEGIVLPLNPKYIIGSSQNGGRIRYLDGAGNNYTGVTPTGQVASWVAPLVYDPNNQMTVYSFGTKVHKSTDFGTTWTDLGAPTTFTGSTIETATIAENNSNRIVVSKQNHLELSTDGGLTFASIMGNLPSNLYISDVTFDPNNDNTIIVTYADVSSAYGQNKVFISTNSGVSWTNITYNLGYMPVHNAIVANGIIYIGAEIGVYYKSLSGTSWALYNTNLPNASVRELEVNYGANTIKAVTWGRGLWEEKLIGRENYPSIVKTEITSPPTFNTPKSTVPQFVTSQIQYSGTLTNVFVSWATGTPNFNTTNVIPMILISGTTWKSSSALPDFPAGTKVFFKVTATGSNSDSSETYKFMYELKPYTDCVASGENTNGALWINSFSCSNITNVSNDYNSYTYYSSNPIVMFKNSNYTATGNFSTGWSSNDFMVWIDYNNDLDFQPSERVVFDSDTGATGTGSFTIPADAFEGNVKMRVRLGYWGDYTEACGTTLGEVEDYLVTIGQKPVITFSGNTSYCINEPITLSYTGSTIDNLSWELTNGTNTYAFSGTIVNTNSLPIGDYTVKINYTKYGVTFQEVFENNFKVSPIPSAVIIPNIDETICPNVIRTLTATGGNSIGSKASKISGTLKAAIPDNNLTTGFTQLLSISSVPSSATITKVEVLLNITHPWDKDLRINLEAPNGKIVNLFNQHGDTGDNLTNTVITSDTAAQAFTSVATAAPFTGTYRASLSNQTAIATTPAVNTILFSDLFTIPNGDWKLRIYDDGAADLGILLNCSIVLTYNSQSDIIWSPTTNLYSSATCASGTEYSGTNATTIYAKPSTSITYSANVTPQSCLVSDAVTYTINTIPNKFTAGNWTNGIPPTTGGTQIIEFDNPAGYSSTSDISGCSCKVTSGNITINSGTNMILEGALNVSGGSMTFNNNSNLIQKQEVANLGNITYKRHTSPLMRLDYTMWSSPLTGSQSLLQFSPLTDIGRFYNYTTSTNLYNFISNPATTLFEKGRGFLIRLPNNHPTVPTIWAGQFVGNPNNGVTEYNLSYLGNGQSYNMVGNPYPSTISADALLSQNATNVKGTVYFWRKTNAASGTAYATYTLAGATTTSPTSPTPNGIIQVGQGFIVEAKNVTNPKITFTNSMRVSNNTDQFFRSSTDTERNRFWINLTNTSGLFSQMMVGYLAETTNAVDDGYDGKKINDNQISLTSLINNEEYTIQSKGLPFTNTDIVPLSFKTNIAGNFTIALNNSDGLFTTSQDIYLKDNLLQLMQNLSQAQYNFYSEVGDFNTRFEIVYQNQLGYDLFDYDNIILHPNPVETNGYLYIEGIQNSKLTLYDDTGKEVFSSKTIDNKISLKGIASGLYLVKIKSESGQFNKKILVK